MSIDVDPEHPGAIVHTLSDQGERADATVVRGEVDEAVTAAIERLPARYRAALVLRDIEGLSYEEVGSILNIPGGTVRSRINRARLMLREKLVPFVRRWEST